MDKCLVYLPVYNGEKFVRETIESVLSQDYPNYQVVVYDDGSTDSSQEIIQAYIQNHPEKIIYEKNSFNLGVGTTLHNCYKKYHNARYIAQIGHDDVWPGDYLSKQIEALEKSGAAVSFADNDYIGPNGEVKTDIKIFSPELLQELSRKQLFLRILRSNFLCAPASVIDISRLDAEEVTTYWGYNNERLQDCELWLNVCLHGDFYFNKAVKMRYRVHGNNLSDENKRVLQGRMEYYTMLCRILHSSGFYAFLDVVDDPDTMIDDLLDALAQNINYSNPLKLLIIELCEEFLNAGYNSNKIWSYLNWLYMDSGIITKCRKNNQKLCARIEVVLGGTIRAKDVVMSLENSGNFSVNLDMNAVNPHCICVTQDENMEFLLSWPQFYYNYTQGQVVVFCSRTDLEANKKRYPHLLVLPDDIGVEQLESRMYQFLEDQTHIYRNGFFDLITGYGYPDQGYQKVRIDLQGITSIRKVQLLDRAQDELVFWDGNKPIHLLQSDHSCYLLDYNEVQIGEFFIESKNGIGLKDRIVINNVLYTCADVQALPDGSVTPVFRPLSYYNSSFSAMLPTYGELLSKTVSGNGELQIRRLETELVRITNSFSYKAAMKIKAVLAKLRILNPVKALIKRFMD